MQELFRIIAIAVAATAATLILKPIKPEFAILVSTTASVLILILIVNMFTGLFSFFTNLINITGIDENLFGALLKIIGIGYLTEFAANICHDTGNSSLADKILLGGKVVILIVSLPILTGIVDIVSVLLN